MKQKLLKSLRLRLCAFVALVLCAAGNAWGETVTYDFTNISGFEDWGTSYTSREVEYDAATVTFASANHQTSTITNCPVTKGGDVMLVLNDDYEDYVLTSVTFNCTQWGTKAQTITLHYSTDRGSTYTSTNITSSNFTISSSNLPSGTNAVKITFSSSSNQVGIASVSITYQENTSSAVATTVAINSTGITNTDVYTNTAAGSLSATVSAEGNTISGASIIWSGNNDAVATINASTGAVTLVSAGEVVFTASYAGVTDQYLASSATYNMTVVDSTPFAGGDVTFDATKDKGNTTAGEGSIIKNCVTFACNNGILGNGTEYRLYKNSTTSFSTTQGTITEIVFTGTSGNPISNFGTTEGLTFDGNNGTWTGNANSVSFTASENQVRATQIVVTVDLSATPDPVISASDVNVAYDVTTGEIEYTIANAVSGTSLVASTEATWLSLGTVGETSIPFTCSVNDGTESRTATVTLTYGTITETVTVTQAAAPVIYTTIPTLFAAATSTETEVKVTFNNWVVSGVSTNGKNVFVTDNAGNGFVIYSSSDQSGTYAVGNILSGTAVSCNLVLYSGFAELKNLNASDLSITSGGTVTVSDVAMADLSGVNTGALVSYENLTCNIDNNKYYLTDGTTTLQVFNSLYAFEALEAGKIYNITGIYQQYNNTKEILPRSAADIEEVVSTEPSISIAETTVNVSSAESEGTIDITYANLTISDMNDFGIQFYDADDNELNGNDVPNWIEVLVAEQDPQVGEGYVVSYTIDANDGAARTAYFKIYVDQTYSNLVTVTQAAYVAPATPGNWVLTNLADLTADDVFVIVGTYEDIEHDSYAMSNDKGTSDPPTAVAVTVVDNTLSGEIADNIKWNVSGNATNGYTFYPNGTTETWLYCTNTNNGVRVGTNDNKTFKIDSESNYLKHDATSRYIGIYNTQDWRCYTNTTGNIAGQTFAFYKYVEEETPIVVTVGSALYTTYVAPANVTFPDGLTAYIVDNVTETSMNLREIDAVEEGTPIILKAEVAGDYTLSITDKTDDASDNWLQASDGTVSGGENIYALAKKEGVVAFYQVNASVTIPAGKAYLDLEHAPGAKALTFTFTDADGIKTIEIVSAEAAAEIFNLAGQRMSRPVKGVNIINGKKVVVK